MAELLKVGLPLDSAPKFEDLHALAAFQKLSEGKVDKFPLGLAFKDC
jgi:hypothetical protein